MDAKTVISCFPQTHEKVAVLIFGTVPPLCSFLPAFLLILFPNLLHFLRATSPLITPTRCFPNVFFSGLICACHFWTVSLTLLQRLGRGATLVFTRRLCTTHWGQFRLLFELHNLSRSLPLRPFFWSLRRPESYKSAPNSIWFRDFGSFGGRDATP